MAAYISEEIENESETLALSMSASLISKLKRVGIPAVTAAAKSDGYYSVLSLNMG